MAILRYTFSVVQEKLKESQKYKTQQSVSGENLNWLSCIYDLEALNVCRRIPTAQASNPWPARFVMQTMSTLVSYVYSI
jgi:hypothetical protein